MEPTYEYAEQYTRRERVRFVLLAVIVGGAFILAWETWVLPLWVKFVETSPCYQFFGVSGTSVVFYALFVGLPLMSAFLVTMAISLRGFKILRDKQVPYRGEKVFRPTKIRHGPKAVRSGWAHLLAPVPFLAIAVWGALQARELVTDFNAANFDYSKCENRAMGIEIPATAGSRLSARV